MRAAAEALRRRKERVLGLITERKKEKGRKKI